MNLDDCQKVRIADIDPRVAYTIMQVEPNLHDFTLHLYEGEYINIDFYFKDDPKKDEVGYCGTGIEEFIPDSPSYRRLCTIIDILFYCLGLKEGDTNLKDK